MSGRALLLSIAPQFAQQIAAGSKTVELRRRFPSVPAGTWVYLYATLPVGAVIGRVKVQAVEVDAPSTLWARHGGQTGISRERFDAYFGQRAQGVAVRVNNYEAVGPIALRSLRAWEGGFVVPQSYRYLDEDQLNMLDGGAR